MFGDTLLGKLQIGAGIILITAAAAATYFYVRKKLRERSRRQNEETASLIASGQPIETEVSPEALESGMQQDQQQINKLRSSPPSRTSSLFDDNNNNTNNNDGIYYDIQPSQPQIQQKSLFTKAAGPQRRNVNGNVNRSINSAMGDLDFGIYPTTTTTVAKSPSPPISIVVDGSNDKSNDNLATVLPFSPKSPPKQPLASTNLVPNAMTVKDQKESTIDAKSADKIIADDKPSVENVAITKPSEEKTKTEEASNTTTPISTSIFKSTLAAAASTIEAVGIEDVDDDKSKEVEIKKKEENEATNEVKKDEEFVTKSPKVEPVGKKEEEEEEVIVEPPKVVSDEKKEEEKKEDEDKDDKEVKIQHKRHSSASPMKERVEVPIELASSVVKPSNYTTSTKVAPAAPVVSTSPKPVVLTPTKPAPSRPSRISSSVSPRPSTQTSPLLKPVLSASSTPEPASTSTSPSPEPAEEKKESESGIVINFPSVAMRRKTFMFKVPIKPPSPVPIQNEERKGEPQVLNVVKKASAPAKRRPTRNPLKDRKKQEESGILSSTTVNTSPKSLTPTPVLNPSSPVASPAAPIRSNDMKRLHKRAATMTNYSAILAAKAEALRSGVTDDSDDYFKKKMEEKGLILPKHKPRLFQIQGHRRPFVKQVELSWKSFRTNCSYVLDTGKNGRFLYRWDGAATGHLVKATAMNFGKNLHDKERFNTKVVYIAQGDETPEFFDALCGKGAGKPEGWDDMPRIPGTPKEIEEVEKAFVQSVCLKRVIYDEAAGTSELEDLDVHGKTLVKGILNDNECFILDCGSEVYSWAPLKAKTKYKNEAVKRAEEIAAKHREEENGTRWVAPVYNELAGEEQVIFRERFSGWNSVPIGVSAGPSFKFEKKELPSDYFNVDVVKLYDNKSLVVPEDKKLAAMVDSTVANTTGEKITIFIVEEFKRIPIPPEDFGHFYSGETYVILYQFVWKNKDCHIIYFWQGKNSSVLGKGTSAALTKELDDKMKLNACMSLEVRVVQGKEPKHFVGLFKDKFVVHQGMDPHSSVGKPLPTNVPRMYHIEKKRLAYHISAVQTKEITSRVLNSCNTFVLAVPAVEPKVEKKEDENVEVNKEEEKENDTSLVNKKEGYAYVWMGRLSGEDEQKYAHTTVERLKNIMKIKNTITIKEGEEPDEFWADIGGKFEYPTQTFTTRYYPRFYHCSVASGYKVDEVINFTQEDLEPIMAVIFDVYYAVYVWIGSKAHQLLKRHSLETAQEYLKYAISVDKRPENTPILRVQESEEPMVFSVYFQGWQMKPVKKGLPIPIQTYNNGLVSADDLLKDYNRKYTYDDLVNKRYPPGLDETALENYLEDAEFESVFGCNREAFNKLSIWKKNDLKRAKKLY